MNRHALILEFALSSLGRHKAKALTIGLAYALVIFLWCSVLMLSQGLKQEALAVLSRAPELIVQRLSGGRLVPAPLEYAETIRGIRGVGRVLPRVWGYYYDPPTGSNYTVLGADGFPSELSAMVEGGFYEKGAGRACVIGQGVADARFAATGDIIPMKRADGGIHAPRVTGIFTSESALLTNDLIVMGTASVRELFGLPGSQATDLAVQVKNPREALTVAKKIQEALPDTRPVSRDQILNTYEAVFDWRAGVAGMAAACCVLCFILLAWDKATGLSEEQRRTIGVLKASGWSTSDVLEWKFWEGGAISLTAFFAGVTAAYAHVVWWDGSLLAPVMKGWSTLLPEFRVCPRMDLFQFFLLLALAVVPYMAATLIPSWKAAATDPLTAMRG